LTRTPPSPASLAALCALGLLTALWSVVLWGELRVMRAGGDAFCALDSLGSCAQVWDSRLAGAVHARTGVPVAGWGVAWSLVACGLALAALLRRAQGVDDPALVTALRVTAAGGALGVALLMVAVALDRTFCGGCAVIYVLVAGFAGIALAGWPQAGWPDLSRAMALCGSLVVVAWLALLHPGSRTPKSTTEAAHEAVAATPRSPGRPGELAALVASLEPPLKQALSDSLAIYKAAPARPEPEPRSYLVGDGRTPVRITEFTDIRCSHCADLHRTLMELKENLPPGSFSVVPRQFPLDAACNPALRSEPRDPVRCLSARALICAEGQPGAGALAGAMFERQSDLGEADVRALFARNVPAVPLDTCLADPQTEQKLQADIALATGHGIEGTPLVLVNGRRGTSFGPFLYAMVLTQGAPDHPDLAALPPPNPSAHLH
jgi:protein-disulfide isomerase